MKHRVTLTITSLLTILFTAFHLTCGIVHMLSARGLWSLRPGQPR